MHSTRSDHKVRLFLISDHGLTPAEAEIATAIASGMDLGAIAAGRDVSIQTVRSQVKAIFRKTGINSQVQLVTLILKRSSASHSTEHN